MPRAKEEDPASAPSQNKQFFSVVFEDSFSVLPRRSRDSRRRVPFGCLVRVLREVSTSLSERLRSWRRRCVPSWNSKGRPPQR